MRMACPIGPGLMTRSSRSLRIFHMVAGVVRCKATKVLQMLEDSIARRNGGIAA